MHFARPSVPQAEIPVRTRAVIW